MDTEHRRLSVTPRQGIRCSCGRLLATRSPYSFTAVEIKRRGELVATVSAGTIVCPSCRQLTRIGDDRPHSTRPDVFEVMVGAGSPVEVSEEEGGVSEATLRLLQPDTEPEST